MASLGFAVPLSKACPGIPTFSENHPYCRISVVGLVGCACVCMLERDEATVVPCGKSCTLKKHKGSGGSFSFVDV